MTLRTGLRESALHPCLRIRPDQTEWSRSISWYYILRNKSYILWSFPNRTSPPCSDNTGSYILLPVKSPHCCNFQKVSVFPQSVHTEVSSGQSHNFHRCTVPGRSMHVQDCLPHLPPGTVLCNYSASELPVFSENPIHNSHK